MRAIQAMVLLLVTGFGVPHARAQTAPPPSDEVGILCGIDVLARENYRLLAGRRVGLITNHTGRDRFGHSTLALLHDSPDVNLVTLFGPEHGIRGELDAHVPDSTDQQTGLKVYSLYGKNRRPTAEMLEGIDTLVFDIQDIGTRFYTYIATMGMAMEEAARHGIRFIVLDRPNPITGTRVFGPYNDREGAFTAYHKVPLVHGMTIGELARMFNAERQINADLLVVEMKGWKRSMWLDETGQTWVDPSPNMRSLTQATLYPAIGLIEACNVSVGRGTDTPFERFGAPWINERALAARLNSLNLAGIRFLPYRFTPESSKHKHKSCGGVQILLTDRNAFDPLETGLSITRELKNLYGDTFQVDRVNNLLFEKSLLGKVTATSKPTRYTPLWADQLKDFNKRRAAFLIYP